MDSLTKDVLVGLSLSFIGSIQSSIWSEANPSSEPVNRLVLEVFDGHRVIQTFAMIYQ